MSEKEVNIKVNDLNHLPDPERVEEIQRMANDSVDQFSHPEITAPPASDFIDAPKASESAEEVASSIASEVEKIQLDEAQPVKERRHQESYFKLRDAITNGDIVEKTENNVTRRIPLTDRGKEVLDEYRLSGSPTVGLEPITNNEDNGENNIEDLGGAMSEESKYSQEEIARMNDSRLERYGQMRAEGATEDTRRNAEGVAFPDSFSPTAEQIAQAEKEMNEYEENKELEPEPSTPDSIEKSNQEIKDLAAQRDEIKDREPRAQDPSAIEKSSQEIKDIAAQREEIRDKAEEIVETVEGKELTVQELIKVLKEELSSLKARIEALSAAAAVAKKETVNLQEESVEQEEVLPNSAEGTEGIEGDVDDAENDGTLEGAETQVENTEAMASESSEETLNDESQEKFDRYLVLLAGRRRWLFGRPSKEQLVEARAEFERAVIDKSLSNAEKIVNQNYPELKGAERESMIRAQAAAEMVYHMIDRTAAEEEIQNRSLPRRAFNWIKQHPRLRLLAGLALTGGAVASMATGNVVGATACITARGALSGLGTGMMVEGAADYVQTKTNQKLRNLNNEQIAAMSPEELRGAISAIGAYEIRRGRSFEDSKFKETVLNILAQQEQDLIRRMEELEGQSENSEIARGRALTEYLNQMNLERESADLDERSKSITRGVAAGLAGTVVAGISIYFGTRPMTEASAPTEVTEAPGGTDTAGDVTPEITDDMPGGGEFPPRGDSIIPEDVNPVENVEAGTSLPSGEIITTAQSGDHIWGITENNLEDLADRLGYKLTPSQMEAAIDRGKDWYVANGFGRGPKNWLWVGDKIPFDLRQGTEWLRYGMDHPKL